MKMVSATIVPFALLHCESWGVPVRRGKGQHPYFFFDSLDRLEGGSWEGEFRTNGKTDERQVINFSACFSSFCVVFIFFTTIVFLRKVILRTAEWLTDVLSRIVLSDHG